MNDATAPRFVEAFGFRVFSDDLARIPLRAPCATVSTISPNSYGMATRDSEFREALKQADYLVLDGVYFALSSILLSRRTIRPNQGPDVFAFFMQAMNERAGRVFFLGSTDNTLDSMRRRAAREYPRVQTAAYSPPFRQQFSESENAEMVKRVNVFSPDILFIGMTAPKQEKWAHQHKPFLNASLAISVGAVFDWYAGNERAIAPLWWKLRLAWLLRTIHRPEILRRYPNIFIFFGHLMLAIVGVKKYSDG